MRSAKQELIDQFVKLVEWLNQQLHSRPPEAWVDLELTLPQVRILMLLRQEPHRVENIAAYLGRTVSSARSTVDRLVHKGLVERVRDPSDHRVVIWQLTFKGRKAIEQFWCIGRMRITEVANSLTTNELQDVIQGMEILSRTT